MRVILAVLSLAMVLSAAAGPLRADEAETREALRQTALDYIEGWYEGDAERMERALHPEFAKRAVMTDRTSGRSRLDQMSAMTLVQYTRAGYGKQTPVEDRQADVTILDIYENAAVVKVVAHAWIDYLQIAKFNGRWVIVNVLWELKPESGE
ncbi:MAG TPA: nuclear transport factor 2 family protein [Candidatus Krumholzibacterium sp.]|nr:nuclear transport factor 2 family protein [Candidatus Krumholzibacterium sp.]